MSERVGASVAEGENTIEERHNGAMWELEQKLDQSMDEEANKLKIMYREKGLSMWMLLTLSFQSLGIVYGDLGTSPLYVFYNTFPDGIKDSEDVIGALSLIIYSLLLIPLIKYVFIVCKANDNGQGGTLAIYSLLCRHAKVKLIPNQQRSDEDLTTYSRTLVTEGSFAAKTKKWLESKESRKRALLFVVLLGTCMMIGDGILTPAISVLSATGGIKVSSPKMSSDIVVVMSIVILVGLFSMQHYGTDKVGWLFAPIVFIWTHLSKCVLVSFDMISEEISVPHVPEDLALWSRLPILNEILEWDGRVAFLKHPNLENDGDDFENDGDVFENEVVMKVWVTEDAEKNQWSSKTLVLPPSQMKIFNMPMVVNLSLKPRGTSRKGEVILVSQNISELFVMM
ncbi:hypothetical protein F2Q68_00037179 [Brassica cretica]|uniref:K+ potassium transporter integral membrane domain-containing protein n=1 Tax=Brassica cretica TaxID=69181 RepID=A0A8S9GX25_BRACR|nr:hypothetical protein F2Q68_00037179 [Brassica cretica]